ncbi:MAG: T9SS type A sorting domain-containing protein [Sphingobacteriales bacterium JAD_PAG50586_3]|nr:MAG: T9SS type A sorting domain-containing protein [Sphingobacteriales bacterium JAD_PAG50586_3]
MSDSFQVMAVEDVSNFSYEFTLSGSNTSVTETSTTATTYMVPQEVGTHDLLLVASNGCITATDQVSGYLTVYAQPTYTLNTVDALGGPNGSAWLSNYANVNSITWLDANNQPLSANDSIQNLAAGTYTVVVTNGGVTQACSFSETFTIELGGAVGEFATAKINMYPNPASDKLFIDLNAVSTKITHAQVFNSTGALVMSQAVNGQALLELDVNTLPAGIYSILLNGSNQSYSARWIKN